MRTFRAEPETKTRYAGAGALGLVRPLAKGAARKRKSPRPPAFLIVGTGRCGTHTVSDHLTRVGIPCTHEEAFALCGPVQADNGVGDASWLALPYLDSFVGPIVHLVREPTLVVRSLVDLRFFSRRHNPYYWYAKRCLPSLTGDDIDDALTWCEWANATAAKHADVRVRLEDFALDASPLSLWLADRLELRRSDLPRANLSVERRNGKAPEKLARAADVAASMAMTAQQAERLHGLNMQLGYE